MRDLGRLWDHVWPTVVSMAVVGAPPFAWHHWRISVKLSRHLLQVTGVLDRKLKIMVEVDDAGADASAPDAGQQSERQ